MDFSRWEMQAPILDEGIANDVGTTFFRTLFLDDTSTRFIPQFLKHRVRETHDADDPN